MVGGFDRDSSGRIDSIDLFCGAGGLALGLAQAGFHCRLANDIWEPAAQTFKANFPSSEFLLADARDLTRSDVLARAGLA